MIFISHRGNIEGPIKNKENSLDYIQEALNLGFDVEIDLWYIDDNYFLGHDLPEYKIKLDWILERCKKLWVHCKNVECVIKLKSEKKRINYFWHENDKVTLTSKNYIWAYPGNQPMRDSISVLPELNDDNISFCKGVCSDFILKYKKKINDDKKRK